MSIMDHLYKLKFIHRYTSNFRIHTENVAEHSYYVSCLVMDLTKCYKFNLQKALQMAIVHDWPEIWITDVSHKVKRLYPEVKQALKKAEATAIADKLPDYSDLFNELEEGKSVEALIVHLADAMQCMLYINNEINLGNSNSEFFDMRAETDIRITNLMQELHKQN